jgi:signal transduction histidine kinase
VKTKAFTVDAALLQELGERLIGRAPIALAELIKNSYDADASTVRIEFKSDEIVISDDGTGMSSEDFLDHWMRIGTTHKVDQRVSPLGRSLTGSKGIGRLSVQFLAEEMELESTTKGDPESLIVLVDWSTIIRGAGLDTVTVAWDTQPASPNYPNGSKTGTRITLRKLKHEWDAESIETLGREVWLLRSPFRRTLGKSSRRSAEVFDIEIDAPEVEAAQEAFDLVRRQMFESWKARISGTLKGGRRGSAASITVEFKEGYPEGAKRVASFTHTVDLPIARRVAVNEEERDSDDKSRRPEPSLLDEASFEIFVFLTEGRQKTGIPVNDLRKYLSEFGNVSVYDAGFRLPYYGSGRDPGGQDWLGIAIDQGRRLSVSELLPNELQASTKYMLDLPAPGRIFGAVDINTNHERSAAIGTNRRTAVRVLDNEWLEIQSGRDRLKDNKAFAQLRNLVRLSLDLYANRYRQRSLQVSERGRDAEPLPRKFDRVERVLSNAKGVIPKDIYREVTREIREARAASAKNEEILDRRAALLAPLATAGIAALALNHELGRESRYFEATASRLTDLARRHKIPELRALADELIQATSRLDALRRMFSPLTSEEDVEASVRIRIRSLVQEVTEAMSVLMPGVTFDLTSVSPDLRFPLGSVAEWHALLQNVLTNAWNAMLDSQRAEIGFRGGKRGGSEWLHISDTGVGLGMPIEEAAELFNPFERRLKISDDRKSIAIGGQGLGLAIVRMIAERRGARVRFVEPEQGFSTTIEISWKGARK